MNTDGDCPCERGGKRGRGEEGKVPAGGGTSQRGEIPLLILGPVSEFFIYFSTYSSYK